MAGATATAWTTAVVMSNLLNYCYGIVVFLFDLQGWNCELNWVMGIDFDGGDL
jgi:hypothetical protein